MGGSDFSGETGNYMEETEQNEGRYYVAPSQDANANVENFMNTLDVGPPPPSPPPVDDGSLEVHTSIEIPEVIKPEQKFDSLGKRKAKQLKQLFTRNRSPSIAKSMESLPGSSGSSEPTSPRIKSKDSRNLGRSKSFKDKTEEKRQKEEEKRLKEEDKRLKDEEKRK